MLLQLNSLSSKVTATIASVPGEFSVLHSGPVLPGAAPFLHSLSHSFTQQVKHSPSIDAPSMLCKKKMFTESDKFLLHLFFSNSKLSPRRPSSDPAAGLVSCKCDKFPMFQARLKQNFCCIIEEDIS